MNDSVKKMGLNYKAMLFWNIDTHREAYTHEYKPSIV